MNRKLFATLALVFALLISNLTLAEENTFSVNLNTATSEVLAEALQGIGESKAKAIVEYREANGPFKSVEDLAKVKGIGASTIDKNRDSVVVE